MQLSITACQQANQHRPQNGTHHIRARGGIMNRRLGGSFVISVTWRYSRRIQTERGGEGKVPGSRMEVSSLRKRSPSKKHCIRGIRSTVSTAPVSQPASNCPVHFAALGAWSLYVSFGCPPDSTIIPSRLFVVAFLLSFQFGCHRKTAPFPLGESDLIDRSTRLTASHTVLSIIL